MELGIPPEEFWGLTLRHLDLLMERARERERRINYRFGLLASLLYNRDRPKGAQAIGPMEFFEPKAPTVKTREEMREKLAQLRAHFTKMRKAN